MVRIVKILAGTVVALVLVIGFAVFVLQVPLPWRSRAVAKQAESSRVLVPVELVEGKRNTVRIPDAVGRALGVRQADGKDAVASADAPKQARPLVLPGSTALDPARIMRIRARFAPAEVVSVAEVEEKKLVDSMPAEKHELRPGDEIRPGMELGTFFSPDAGNKKNDLFEAIVQMRLDEVILKKAEDSSGSLPEIYLWTARRNVDTDRSAVRRARNTLLTWGVEKKDIDEVVQEAMKLGIADARRKELAESDWTEKHDKWAKIVLKAPEFKGESAVVVERNVSRGEVVVDNTINLFTLARVDHLLVYANCPEDDLPELYRLKAAGQLRWTVQTVGTEMKEGVEGTITEIGWIIDPNQHTAIIKGFIPNPGGKIRAGQFANATIELLAPKNVVEIPTDAVVEDGMQSIVFVQTDAAKHEYAMRRVQVVSRFEKTMFVRSAPFPAPEQMTEAEKAQAALDRKQGLLPLEALAKNTVVLKTGVMELKSLVIEKEAARRSKEGVEK